MDAIHPGYGLLSENANFAEVCRASNIKFIGPPPEVTRMMGEKSTARQTMKKAKVPILPGSDGVIANEGDALDWAKSVGYPVILKAVAGGGGRGMRICRNAAELPAMFNQASTEAANAFGNGDLYMEKFIERPAPHRVPGARRRARQRDEPRRTRVLHPAPPPEAHRRSAIAADHAETPRPRPRQSVIERSLKDIGYWNAGTIEFLMDEDGKIYFIEMNTRIQVEHCVTEMVTGIDLVKAQLRIAAGEKLSSSCPEARHIRGHAIECRINAEHPEKFTPSAGKITAFNLPGGNGVRVDTRNMPKASSRRTTTRSSRSSSATARTAKKR